MSILYCNTQSYCMCFSTAVQRSIALIKVSFENLFCYDLTILIKHVSTNCANISPRENFTPQQVTFCCVVLLIETWK